MESECQLELICSVVHVELYDFFSVCVSICREMCCSYSLKDSSEVCWSDVSCQKQPSKKRKPQKTTQTTTTKNSIQIHIKLKYTSDIRGFL